MRLPCAPQRPELGERVSELAVGLAESSFEVEVSGRHRRGKRPSTCGHLGLGRGPLIEQPASVTLERVEVRREPGVAQLGAGGCSARRVVDLASLAFERRPGAEFRGERGRRRFRRGKLRQRPIRSRRHRPTVPLGDGQPTGRLVPASVHREHQRSGQLIGGRLARRLLLGLGGESPRLRPQFAEDVLDSRKVRLRFDQLLLGSSAPALVAPDTGDLLEERPALLGPERERLVDHPLADEQEGVVGQVRRIEQVDEVAQPDPALVQEVVVLARAIEPPTELEDLEIDREEAIGVIEDERDIGHPLGGPLLRPGPDDVFRLARSERTTLLAERPAQRVGKIALARAVRADHGADPRPELDIRPLRERLEPVEAQRQETRLCGAREVGHNPPTAGASAGSVAAWSASSAWLAASVSAARRDGPAPSPTSSSSTQTSTRNERSWSGPVASSSR